MLSETENGLQYLLDISFEMGKHVGHKFNIAKSHVIHHRPVCIDRTEFVFSLSLSNIFCISQCTYIGIVMDDLDFNRHTCTWHYFGISRTKKFPFNAQKVDLFNALRSAN